jgi:hypothetical protein
MPPTQLFKTAISILNAKVQRTGLENRDYGCGDPLRWPRDTLYQLKLSLTSPAGCGRSVGIVHLRTKKPQSRVESSRVESSRVESSRVESSRVKSSQVKSSQVESSQVKSSQGAKNRHENFASPRTDCSLPILFTCVKGVTHLIGKQKWTASKTCNLHYKQKLCSLIVCHG